MNLAPHGHLAISEDTSVATFEWDRRGGSWWVEVRDDAKSYNVQDSFP